MIGGSVAKMPRECLKQLRFVDRLGEKVVAATCTRARFVAMHRVRGERDDRDMRESVIGLEPARHLPPTQARQPEIHQDEIRFRLGYTLEGRLAIFGDKKTILLLEQLHQQIAV